MTVKRQTAVSIFWLGVATIVTRAFSALQMLILAKLLLPADFGLVQVATLAISSLELFRELGFGSALIYWRREVEDAADTAFLIILSSSLLIYLIAFFGAEPLMQLISKDAAAAIQAVPVLRALALTTVISSIGQVPIILLAKDLNFRLKIIPDMFGAIGGGILAIALALAGFGVWSLVTGYVVEALIVAVAVWFVSSWRPRWRLRWTIAKEMFAYGKSIVGSQILVFLITHIDDAFVSKLLGPASLGHYGFAYNTSNLPATHITRLVGQVTFPAFSKVQDSLETLRDIYLKTTHYVSLVSVPAAICIIAFAPEFIHDVYGDKWVPAIVPLQLLGIYGLIRSVAANMGNVFKAGGKPQWLMGIALFRLVLTVAGLYPATYYYGITGVSALSAAIAVLDFAISLVLTNRIVQMTVGQFMWMLLPILVNATVAAAVAKVAYPQLRFLPVAVALPLAGVIMLIAYGLLTWTTDAESRQMARTLWREARRRGGQFVAWASAKVLRKGAA